MVKTGQETRCVENRKEREKEGEKEVREVTVHHTPDPQHLSAFRPTDGAALTSAS